MIRSGEKSSAAESNANAGNMKALSSLTRVFSGANILIYFINISSLFSSTWVVRSFVRSSSWSGNLDRVQGLRRLIMLSGGSDQIPGQTVAEPRPGGRSEGFT